MPAFVKAMLLAMGLSIGTQVSGPHFPFASEFGFPPGLSRVTQQGPGLNGPQDAGPPGEVGDILSEFHTARSECLRTFFSALGDFHTERRSLLQEIRSVARSDAEDKDAQIAALEGQIASLEQAKDAAEGSKASCIQAAEDVKDQALSALD